MVVFFFGRLKEQMCNNLYQYTFVYIGIFSDNYWTTFVGKLSELWRRTFSELSLHLVGAFVPGSPPGFPPPPRGSLLLSPPPLAAISIPVYYTYIINNGNVFFLTVLYREISTIIELLTSCIRLSGVLTTQPHKFQSQS